MLMSVVQVHLSPPNKKPRFRFRSGVFSWRKGFWAITEHAADTQTRHQPTPLSNGPATNEPRYTLPLCGVMTPLPRPRASPLKPCAVDRSLWMYTMNRWAPTPHLSFSSNSSARTVALVALVALFVAAWAPTTAVAQMAGTSAWVAGVQSQPMRHFPAKARRAQMVVTTAMDVTLNDQPARLSPGARLRNHKNSLVLTGSLVGQTHTVNYVLDTMGQVHEVWLLNAAEAAQPRAGSEGMSTTNVVSDSDATR